MTNLGAIVAQLKQERDKLNRAIEVLDGSVGTSRGGGARKLSAAARARIAAPAGKVGEVQGEEALEGGPWGMPGRHAPLLL